MERWLTIEEIREDVKHFNEIHRFGAEKSDYPQVKALFELKEDSFEMIRGKESGKFFYFPAQSIYGLQLFRGQHADWPECLPTLYRDRFKDGRFVTPTLLDIFIDRMRLVEFELMLKSHTFVKDWFEPNNIFVDFEGLAQHYGLNTEIIDFTADLEVALFFAICRYDKSDDSYHLPGNDFDHKGVILVLNPVYYKPRGLFRNDINLFEDELRPIGLQPFERPALQKGYGLRLQDGKGLKRVRKYNFRYTDEEAREIHEKFTSHNRLMVNDELIEPTRTIANKRQFARKVFSIAWDRFPIPKMTKSECKKLLKKFGIEIDSFSPIETFSPEIWNGSNPFLRARYEKYIGRMVARKVMTLEDDPENPGKKIFKDEAPCIDTQLLANSLMLRVTQTGRSASALTEVADHPDKDIENLAVF